MAIPKSLRYIDKSRAERLIKKHLEAGTGEYEYPNQTGDFIYKDGTGYHLIRDCFGHYETGKLSL